MSADVKSKRCWKIKQEVEKQNMFVLLRCHRYFPRRHLKTILNGIVKHILSVLANCGASLRCDKIKKKKNQKLKKKKEKKREALFDRVSICWLDSQNIYGVGQQKKRVLFDI